MAPNLIRASGEGADYAYLIRAIYRKSTFVPRYYIAPLHIGGIVHQIYKYIEVASMYMISNYHSLKAYGLESARMKIPHIGFH